jgi:polyphosphate kinase
MGHIGRLLEHSRVWHFANGGAEEFYFGSADWMQRNFDRRVEAVTPVTDVALHDRLRSVLATYLSDTRLAWDLDASGRYTQRRVSAETERASQIILTQHPWGEPPQIAPPPAPAEPRILETPAAIAG